MSQKNKKKIFPNIEIVISNQYGFLFLDVQVLNKGTINIDEMLKILVGAVCLHT